MACRQASCRSGGISVRLSAYEGALAIGTDADECWSGHDRFVAAHTSGAAFTPVVESLEAHSDVSIAWAAMLGVIQTGISAGGLRGSHSARAGRRRPLARRPTRCVDPLSWLRGTALRQAAASRARRTPRRRPLARGKHNARSGATGDCESGGRERERGAAGQSAHAVPMQDTERYCSLGLAV